MLYKERISIFVVVAVVLVMTVPRMVINYGDEDDASYSVKAAAVFFNTGVYHPARIPGVPLFEYLLAAIVPWGGCIASNLTVFIFYIVSVWVFSLLVKQRDNHLLLTGIFALNPVLLVNAATTMDYIPALAAILCCYACAYKNKYVLSGIFLGLSIGFRISGVLFAIPVCLFLLLRGRRIYEIIIFFLLSISIGFMFYIPIFAQMGRHIFDVQVGYWPGPDYLQKIIYFSVELFGALAAIGILLLTLVSGKNVIQSIKRDFTSKSASFILEITAVALFVILFIFHPQKLGYLIPVIPFFLLLISRWFSRKQLIFIGILIVSFAFFKLEFKGGNVRKRKLTFRPDWGVVIRDYINRNEMNLLRANIGKIETSDKAVIITDMGPKLTYANDALVPAEYKEISPALQEKGIWEATNIHRIAGRQVYLIYGLSKDNLAVLRKQGYDIYMFSTAGHSAVYTYGYDPYEAGLKFVEVLNEKAFYRDKK